MRKSFWNQILFGVVACGLMAPALPLYGETTEEEQPIVQNGYGYSNNGSMNNQNWQQQQPQQQQQQPQQRMGQMARKIDWQTDYNRALQMAKRQNKPILLYFTGSDWCGWCKKLDSEVLNTTDFSTVAGDKFIFVKLDFPREGGGNTPPNIIQQNNDLKQRFGVSGFPSIVLLDPNGNFVAETGYRPGGGREFGYFLLQFFPEFQQQQLQRQQ